MSSSSAAAHPRSGSRGAYAKSSETRQRILAAAIEVAGDVGLHKASVARIAARAGVAAGNLHYHYGSRDELLGELMEWLVEELHRQVEAAMPAEGSALEREEAAFRTYLAYVKRNPAYVRLAEEIRLHQPVLYQRGIALWLTMWCDGLREGVARGELRAMEEGEIAALAHFLLGARYFLDQMIAGVGGQPYPGDDAVVDAYLNLVRHGLTK
jgi:AcrR family transcriptional regulator